MKNMINKVKVELNEYKEISTCENILAILTNNHSRNFDIENEVHSIHNKYFHSFEFDLINLGYTTFTKYNWIYELQNIFKNVRHINMGNVFIYFDDEVERLNFKL